MASEPQNPLEIQELLDCAISFVSNPPDLLSCALVARAWVVPAQSRLFRAPQDLDLQCGFAGEQADLLYKTLKTNPSLALYVRELRLWALSSGSVAARGWPESIDGIEFANLENLEIELSRRDPEEFRDSYAKLLAQSSLRRLKLDLRRVWPSPSLIRAFQRCSPTIQHLELYCGAEFGDAQDVRLPAIAPLKSLALKCWYYADDEDDNSAPPEGSFNLYPFDLSQLTAFAVRGGNFVPWSILPTQNIRVLELWGLISRGLPAVDLSLLPHLSNLHISLNTVPPTILTTLRTINSSHRIRAITIFFDLQLSTTVRRDRDNSYITICHDLDNILSSVPMDPLPAVALGVEFTHDGELEMLFPGMVARNMVQVIPYTGYHGQFLWWKDLTNAL
ncbi:hypothetical protein R3P38DRAFT_2950736 [Favolaschia claudopus]|uniref:F-box domain-containing protein n=1 Tax=Favolaschia claudopus TaxID=2862362 RepID=A0AAW0BDY0_9AGAR